MGGKEKTKEGGFEKGGFRPLREKTGLSRKSQEKESGVETRVQPMKGGQEAVWIEKFPRKLRPRDGPRGKKFPFRRAGGDRKDKGGTWKKKKNRRGPVFGGKLDLKGRWDSKPSGNQKQQKERGGEIRITFCRKERTTTANRKLFMSIQRNVRGKRQKPRTTPITEIAGPSGEDSFKKKGLGEKERRGSGEKPV